MTQYLYLIKCDAGNFNTYYKIGIATDVESRLAQLQTGSPFELTIEECYSFNNSEIAERAIHQAWAKERTRGEWFYLAGEAVDRFQQICSILGGEVYVPDSYEVTAEAVEEAEEVQKEVFDNLDKWDYAAMFADGWRMEKSTSKGVTGRYWCWRKGGEQIGRKYIYGGLIEKLPYPIEEMKVKYSKSERTIS